MFLVQHALQPRFWVLACVAAFAISAQAQEQCERIEPTAPVKGAHVDTPHPEIRWPGDSQASYRLQVAVILPEGRVLASVDTQVVGTRWAFGAPMAVPLAAIKVVVSRQCAHYTVQDLHADPPHFFYDAQAQCTIEPQSLVQVQTTLRWRASAAADRFSITLFAAHANGGDLTEMQRLDRFETSEPVWDLGKLFTAQLAHRSSAPLASASLGSAPRSLLASVQAQCGTLWSRPSAITLRPPQP